MRSDLFRSICRRITFFYRSQAAAKKMRRPAAASAETRIVPYGAKGTRFVPNASPMIGERGYS
eukprot:170636-Pyramimonas_sp.AAC.1